MKKQGFLALVLIAVGGLSVSLEAAEVSRAALLGYSCAGCHGTNGNSKGPATPSLAGVSRDYFIDAMQEYKTGERASTIMGRIARGYSREDIEQLADFFSRQKFIPAPGQQFDPALARKGARLHDKYCEKCHADGGSSSEDDAGILAGQWTPYLRYTLSDIMAGKSHAPKKMKKRLKKLHEKAGDAGIEQLIHYYASKR